MSRRSFADIQKDLDLTFHLKKLEELDPEWKTDRCFERNAPLELEIGSGKGLFLKQAAEKDPNHNFLGIEISLRYAMVTAARLCRAGLKNAIAFNGDAAQFLRERVPDRSLEAVHVYFPDPWWKKSHRKRRIMRADVLQSLEEKLKPLGILHFWTDVEEYYLSTLELIAEKTQFEGPFPVESPQVDEENDQYNTHFERRTLLKKLQVYRSWFISRKYQEEK